MADLTPRQWELIQKLSTRRDELNEAQKKLVDKLMQLSPPEYKVESVTAPQIDHEPGTITPPSAEVTDEGIQYTEGGIAPGKTEYTPGGIQLEKREQRPKPWASRADQPLTEEPFKEIGRYMVGAGETGLRGLSAGAGMVASGLAGILGLATGGTKGAEKFMAAAGEQPVFNYEPKTEAGKVVAPFWEKTTSAPFEPAYSAWGGLTDIAAETAGKIAGPTAAGLVGAGMSVAPIAAGTVLGARAGRKAAKKQYMKAGKATPEFKEALKKHGMTIADIGPEGMAMLEKYNFPDADMAARAAYMKSQGIEPTRAQITRRKSEMMTQQELAKETNQISGRLELQNAQLKNKFDLAAMSEPQKVGELRLKKTSGNPTYDRILDKVTAADNKMFDMYQKAKEKSGGRQTIKANNFEKALDDFMADDDLAGGLVTAIRGVAKKRGFFDTDTGKITRNISADEAESIVQSINKRYKKTGDANKNRVGRELKDALDLDVAAFGSPQLYKAARKMKAKLHRDLRPVKEGKWTKRDISLTEDILNETVNPEEVLTKGILSNKYRPKEIKHLKDYLHSGTPEQKIAGAKAWKDLKAEAIEYIRDEAFQGPLDAKGNRTISRAKFERALKKFGSMDKLKSFFDPEEVKFLQDMQKTLEIIEPPGGTFIGEGPTAAAINRKWGNLERKLKKFDTFKAFENMAFDPEGKALKMPTKALGALEKSAALGAGLAVSPEEEED